MSARILVVDDILANVRLLEARLTAEYYDVVTAMSGMEAIDICERSQCDIILLDVMMPGMDGFEVCQHLKANPNTAHIPVVMVTALDQPSDRVRGLEAGADDFLTKPVNDVALLSRVKSLTRMKTTIDELRNRAVTSRDLGFGNGILDITGETGDHGRVLLVDDRASSHERMRAALASIQKVEIEAKPQEALFRVAEGAFDLVIVSLGLADYDGLRLCSQIRSLERTRHIPILVIAEPDDTPKVVRGLDIGVNDYILRPVDRNELVARVRTQVKKKRYTDRLRDTVQSSMEMAVTDALTGLHNRRYFDMHASGIVEQSIQSNKPMAVLMLDIDHFKAVNDSFGHDAGDEVLREFSARVRRNLRSSDLPCRLGGEEFVILMPDMEPTIAAIVAERLRKKIEAQEFPIQKGAKSIRITVSIGSAMLSDPQETAEQLVKRADEAVYQAKREGRNRVIAAAA